MILASRREPPPIWGVKILGVVATGDFEGKRSRTIFDIYRRLSKGKGIIPPALGFIFDREGRNETEIRDLERESRGEMHFLPRKMYENYLLDAQAISTVMSNIPGFRDTQITDEEVSDWMKEHGSLEENWKVNTNGAEILADIFNEFSETRCPYDKIAHGIDLTKWLLSYKSAELKEVSDFINNVLHPRENYS